MPSRRHLARTAIMQTLFEEDFRGKDRVESLMKILDRNVEELGGGEVVDQKFAKSLLKGLHEYGEEIRTAMKEHAPQWPLERMDRMTRSILMIGTFELLFGGDAPPAVVMNEAIEIAKEFGGEESGKFVNGVLNAIAHD